IPCLPACLPAAGRCNNKDRGPLMNDTPQLIPVIAEGSASPRNLDSAHAVNNSRRDAIKQLALFCALALSAGWDYALAALAATGMNGRRKQLLGEKPLMLLRDRGEIIIPTTDAPGATAAGVHYLIIHFAVYCASKEEQQTLRATLARSDAVNG